MIGTQVVLRAVDDRVLAPDAARQRAFAAVIRRVGRARGLFAFGLADTHGHAALAADGETVGRFVHDARVALAAALGLRLAPAALRPIRDVWHAERVLAYVHRQDARHGACLDPLREGTSLPDLSGLRPDGLWMAGRVREIAPRFRRADLLAQWGIESLTERFDLASLAESGAAAVAQPALAGRSAPVVAARVACVHAGEATTMQLSEALGVSPRTIRELRERTPDAALVRAIRMQMGLRAVVRVANPLLEDAVAAAGS